MNKLFKTILFTLLLTINIATFSFPSLEYAPCNIDTEDEQIEITPTLPERDYY